MSHRRSDILDLGNDGEEDSILEAAGGAPPGAGAAAAGDGQQVEAGAAELQPPADPTQQAEAGAADLQPPADPTQQHSSNQLQVGPTQALGQGSASSTSAAATPVTGAPTNTSATGATGVPPVNSQNPFQALAQPAVTMAAGNRPVVNLNPYTGMPVGTQVGGAKEDFTVESWCKRVEMVSASAGWTTRQAAFNAALALAPNSPAERWYSYASKGGALDTWENFKRGIVKEFAPPATVLDKVNMFKSMKQAKGERAADFANKLHLKFETFEEGLEHLWLKAAYADEATDQKMKDRRVLVVKEVLAYLKMIMFAAGLPDASITEITKAKADSLDGMLEICRLAEAAQAATAQKSKPVAGMSAEPDASEGAASKDEVMQMIAAFMSKEGKPKKQGGAQGRQKDFSKATCFYCNKVGHISPACPVKKEDRGKGVYKVCSRDQGMTKEQWDALPKDRKTWKGRQEQQGGQKATSASLQASAPPPPPPAAFDWWGQYYQGN